MTLKIEKTVRKHTNIFGKEIIDGNAYRIKMVSWFGLKKRYLRFSMNAYELVIELDASSRNAQYDVTLQRRADMATCFGSEEDANTVISMIRNYPDYFILEP